MKFCTFEKRNILIINRNYIVSYFQPKNIGIVNPVTSNFCLMYLFRDLWGGYAFSILIIFKISSTLYYKLLNTLKTS